jgi:hypothetical protein
MEIEDDGFTFKATVTTRPDTKVGSYRGSSL